MGESRSTVALALGGGGARGYAHIGVLDELAARDYEVVRVAGTSMGAIIGALHASGNLEEFREWVLGLRRRTDVLRLLDPVVTGPSAVRVERVLARVAEIVDVRRIEELPLPFTAVATDLWARREVWFDAGPLDPALRASIAIPGVLPPIAYQGRLLVDGGVTDQVPVSALAATSADHTVAVTLDAPSASARGGGPPVHTSSEDGHDDGGTAWTDRLRRRMGLLTDLEPMRSIAAQMTARGATGLLGAGRDRDGHEDSASVEELFDELPAGLRRSDVAAQSLELLMATMQRHQLAAFPPDVLVQVPQDSVALMDFHLAAEQIALGRRRAAEALDRAGLLSGRHGGDERDDRSGTGAEIDAD